MRHIVSIIVATAMMAVGLPSPHASAATKITLLYATTSAYAASWVAQDQGYFEKHGLNVDLSLAPTGGSVLSALIADSGQIGTTTPTTLLQADEQGLDLVIVAGASVYPVTAGSNGVLARTNSGIKGAADLVGRKVAQGGVGSTLDVLGKKWVQSNGIDYHKVNWVEFQFPTMGDALKSGLVDAVVSTNPFYSRILADKIGYQITDFNSVAPRGALTSIYVATRSWAAKNAEAVTAFRAALDEATSYINDPARAASVQGSIAKYTKLSPEIVATQPIPNSLDAHAKPAGIGFWIEVSREQGLIKSSPDPASLIAP